MFYNVPIVCENEVPKVAAVLSHSGWMVDELV